ncbi:MAG: hypothetical protein E6G10_19335 [Actinobacteria bacterium]|nr:MAG: hypothetical protein E6G10_19335 [Actinomycetota bacterium]
MYANYTTVRINDEPAARRLLSDEVVPMVSGAPGFVAGYWLAPQNGEGNAVIIFESEQAARSMAERALAQTSDDAPATIESIETREVIEHARA